LERRIVQLEEKMNPIEKRLLELERKAKRNANIDNRPWEVQWAEIDAKLTREVDEILAPFGGDPASFFDYAEKVNNEAMRKVRK
jgi:hypothetical protein